MKLISARFAVVFADVYTRLFPSSRSVMWEITSHHGKIHSYSQTRFLYNQDRSKSKVHTHLDSRDLGEIFPTAHNWTSRAKSTSGLPTSPGSTLTLSHVDVMSRFAINSDAIFFPVCGQSVRSCWSYFSTITRPTFTLSIKNDSSSSLSPRDCQYMHLLFYYSQRT